MVAIPLCDPSDPFRGEPPACTSEGGRGFGGVPVDRHGAALGGLSAEIDICLIEGASCETRDQWQAVLARLRQGREEVMRGGR